MSNVTSRVLPHHLDNLYIFKGNHIFQHNLPKMKNPPGKASSQTTTQNTATSVGKPMADLVLDCAEKMRQELSDPNRFPRVIAFVELEE